MRVQSVNTMNYAQNQTQSFKGLWGKTIKQNNTSYFKTASAGKTRHDEERTIRYYYPFKNESKESINKAIKENSEYTEGFYNKYNQAAGSYSYSREVEIGPELPFTEKEWNSHRVNPINLRRAISILLNDYIKIQGDAEVKVE